GGRLDLDHVGAEIGEQHRAEGTRHHLRGVEDAEAVQRAGRHSNEILMHTIFQTDGPLATLTFNRPDARNAMTWEMYEALVDACEKVDRDDRIRVFILRGAGGKAFVAGTDISQFQNFKDREDGLKYADRLAPVLDRIERVAKPTIAQVEGVAVGG